MKNDKDTKSLEIICEKIFDYQVRSTKPIQRKVNINGTIFTVRVTRESTGWKAEIFDHTSNGFISADEFLSDIVLKKYSEDIEKFEDSQSSQNSRPKL